MKYTLNGRATPYFNNDGENRRKLQQMNIDDLFLLAKHRRNGVKKVLIDFLEPQNL